MKKICLNIHILKSSITCTVLTAKNTCKTTVMNASNLQSVTTNCKSVSMFIHNSLGFHHCLKYTEDRNCVKLIHVQ